MSSNLPPGVTDQMIEDHVNGPDCDNCGHFWNDHYDEGKENRDDNGILLSACDIIDCECRGFKSA